MTRSRLLHCLNRLAYNLNKLRLETGPTNKGTINIRMDHKFADIGSCHATAIEDADSCRCLSSVHLAIKLTDQMNYLTCSLSSGSTPSADSPDWLVGDHNVFSLLRSEVCQAGMNLS